MSGYLSWVLSWFRTVSYIPSMTVVKMMHAFPKWRMKGDTAFRLSPDFFNQLPRKEQRAFDEVAASQFALLKRMLANPDYVYILENRVAAFYSEELAKHAEQIKEIFPSDLLTMNVNQLTPLQRAMLVEYGADIAAVLNPSIRFRSAFLGGFLEYQEMMRQVQQLYQTLKTSSDLAKRAEADGIIVQLETANELGHLLQAVEASAYYNKPVTLCVGYLHEPERLAKMCDVAVNITGVVNTVRSEQANVYFEDFNSSGAKETCALHVLSKLPGPYTALYIKHQGHQPPRYSLPQGSQHLINYVEEQTSRNCYRGVDEDPWSGLAASVGLAAGHGIVRGLAQGKKVLYYPMLFAFYLAHYCFVSAWDDAYETNNLSDALLPALISTVSVGLIEAGLSLASRMLKYAGEGLSPTQKTTPGLSGWLGSALKTTADYLPVLSFGFNAYRSGVATFFASSVAGIASERATAGLVNQFKAG